MAETPPSLHRYLYVHANPTFFTDPDGRRAATAKDRTELQRLSRLESQLRREYSRSQSFHGQPLTLKQYDHALFDIRTQQRTLVQAVMEAHEGEGVARHLEPASFFDNRGVVRYRPVPSRERWERETRHNERILIATIEAPNQVAALVGVRAGMQAREAVRLRLRQPELPRVDLIGHRATDIRGKALISVESPSAPTVEVVPADTPPGFRTAPLPVVEAEQGLRQSRSQQLERNKEGRDFERRVVRYRRDTQEDVSEQVAIRPNTPQGPADFFVRVDTLGRDPGTGALVPTDAKSSGGAPLTRRQTTGYPLIEEHGGTVIGKAGGDKHPAGTKLPPGTAVRMIRPEDLPPDY